MKTACRQELGNTFRKRRSAALALVFASVVGLAGAHAATRFTPQEMREAFMVTAQTLVVSEDGKRVTHPVEDARKWVGMSPNGEFRSEWTSSNTDRGEFRLRQVWKINDAGVMSLKLEELKSDGSVIGNEEREVKALTPVMYPVKSLKNVVVRFIPDFVVSLKPRELPGQPIVTRGATLFDSEGDLWAFDLESDHQFVGFKTRMGMVALSFTPFVGSHPIGLASGTKITVKGPGTPKLVLQSRGAIVPEGVNAVVHARVLSHSKTNALNSVKVFESTTKSRFEQELKKHGTP